MIPFSFTDTNLPQWVNKTRDEGDVRTLVSPRRIAAAVAEGLPDSHALMRGIVARVYVRYPRDGMGSLRALLCDCSDPNGLNAWQCGSAAGYGYDKLTAALSGGTIGDVTIGDHCDPNGNPTWERIGDVLPYGGVWL